MDIIPGGKPVGSGQFHSPYVYAGNNPLVYVDPDGEIGIFALAWQAYQYFSYASMAFQIAPSTAKGGFGGFIDATTQIGFSMGIGGFVGGIANFGPTLGARISSGVVSGSIAGGVTSLMFGGSFGTGALYGGVSGGIAGGLAYGAEMNSINRASQQQNIDPDEPWTGSPEELIEKYDQLKQIHAKAGDPQIKEATSWNIHKPRYALLDNGLIMDKKTGSRWVWGYTNQVGKRIPLRNGWYGWRSQIRIAPATFMKSTRWSVIVLGHELAHATMNFTGVAWYLTRKNLRHRMEDYAHHWERVTARYYGWNTYY